MVDAVKTETTQRMDKCLDNLKSTYQRIRTGRATPELLSGITVDYYGTPTPLQSVANVSIPEARMIVIQPWEKTILGGIEKAILASDLGLAPQNDGNVIRLNIPALTEQRRKELAKQAKSEGEDAKVAVRNVRRDSNDKLKKFEKNKEMSEDELKGALDEIQKVTDKYVAKVDEIIALKEKEIMTV